MKRQTVLIGLVGIALGYWLGGSLFEPGSSSPATPEAAEPLTALAAMRNALAAASEPLPECDSSAEIRFIDEFGKGIPGIPIHGWRRKIWVPSASPRPPTVYDERAPLKFEGSVRSEAESAWDYAGETNQDGVLVIPLPSGWQFGTPPLKVEGWLLDQFSAAVHAGESTTIRARRGAVLEVDVTHARGTPVDRATIRGTGATWTFGFQEDWSAAIRRITVEPGPFFISARASEACPGDRDPNPKEYWRESCHATTPPPGEFVNLVPGENPPLSLELQSRFWVEAVPHPEDAASPGEPELTLLPKLPGSTPGDSRGISMASRKHWEQRWRGQGVHWESIAPGDYWLVARAPDERANRYWTWAEFTVTDAPVTVEFRKPRLVALESVEIVVRDHNGEIVPDYSATLNARWEGVKGAPKRLRFRGQDVPAVRTERPDGSVVFTPRRPEWERLFDGRQVQPGFIRLDIQTKLGMPGRIDLPLPLEGRFEIQLPPPAHVEIEFAGSAFDAMQSAGRRATIRLKSLDLEPDGNRQTVTEDRLAWFKGVRPGRALVTVFVPAKEFQAPPTVYKKEFEIQAGLNKLRMEVR